MSEPQSDPLNPPPDVLADDHDEDGWDVDQHGRMVEFASDDGDVSTLDWEG